MSEVETIVLKKPKKEQQKQNSGDRTSSGI